MMLLETLFSIWHELQDLVYQRDSAEEALSLNSFGSNDRGDVYCEWIENSEAAVDFVSCNVANDTLVQRRKLNPLRALEFTVQGKTKKI
ncbi:hypothetical protein P9112_000159 [Eukaryota sp. TZLM1-RC]